MSDKKIVSKSKDAYIKRKKDMNFQSVESMQSVVNVVNEAAAALNDKRRTIRESEYQRCLRVLWEQELVELALLQHFMVLV